MTRRLSSAAAAAAALLLAVTASSGAGAHPRHAPTAAHESREHTTDTDQPLPGAATASPGLFAAVAYGEFGRPGAYHQPAAGASAYSPQASPTWPRGQREQPEQREQRTVPELDRATVRSWSPTGPASVADPEAALIHPVLGAFTISSLYGWRMNPTGLGPSRHFHIGQDYAVACGTPVVAAADGVVSFAGERGTGGLRVDVEHADGLATAYRHNSLFVVQVGEQISRGDVIALSGTTGNSTGCHVHFDVMIHGRSVDPATLLPGGVITTGTLDEDDVQWIRQASARAEAPSPVPEAPGGARRTQDRPTTDPTQRSSGTSERPTPSGQATPEPTDSAEAEPSPEPTPEPTQPTDPTQPTPDPTDSAPTPTPDPTDSAPTPTPDPTDSAPPAAPEPLTSAQASQWCLVEKVPDDADGLLPASLDEDGRYAAYLDADGTPELVGPDLLSWLDPPGDWLETLPICAEEDFLEAAAEIREADSEAARQPEAPAGR